MVVAVISMWLLSALGFSWFKEKLNVLDTKIASLETQLENGLKGITCDVSKQTSALSPEITNAIISIESGGDPKAFNKSEGAIGLMQLRPVVYKKLCGLTYEEAFEPMKNVACGSLYMKSLIERFDGNLEQALVYYNSGNAMIDTGYANKVQEKIIN